MYGEIVNIDSVTFDMYHHAKAICELYESNSENIERSKRIELTDSLTATKREAFDQHTTSERILTIARMMNSEVGITDFFYNEHTDSLIEEFMLNSDKPVIVTYLCDSTPFNMEDDSPLGEHDRTVLRVRKLFDTSHLVPKFQNLPSPVLIKCVSVGDVNTVLVLCGLFGITIDVFITDKDASDDLCNSDKIISCIRVIKPTNLSTNLLDSEYA